MKALVIVEDDLDVQYLIETIFSVDPRFAVAGAVTTAEEAVALAKESEPELIVLDHRLDGKLTGFEAVQQFKQVAPNAKIIIFTAHADLKARVDADPSVDAFLLKTDPGRLLPVAQKLTNLLSLM